MSHILQCTLQATPEAPERILQVIRIRGFEVNSMQLRREGERLLVELRLGGERSIENLVRQLDKLIGMESVRCLSGVPVTRAAPASV